MLGPQFGDFTAQPLVLQWLAWLPSDNAFAKAQWGHAEVRQSLGRRGGCIRDDPCASEPARGHPFVPSYEAAPCALWEWGVSNSAGGAARSTPISTSDVTLFRLAASLRKRFLVVELVATSAFASVKAYGLSGSP